MNVKAGIRGVFPFTIFPGWGYRRFKVKDAQQFAEVQAAFLAVGGLLTKYGGKAGSDLASMLFVEAA